MKWLVIMFEPVAADDFCDLAPCKAGHGDSSRQSFVLAPRMQTFAAGLLFVLFELHFALMLTGSILSAYSEPRRILTGASRSRL